MDMEEEFTLPKPRRLRLIPLTVIMLGLLLIIKVNELYLGSRQLREFYGVREATAADAAKPNADAPDTSADNKEAKPADAKAGDKKDTAEKTDATAEKKPESTDEKKADAGDAKKDGKDKSDKKEPEEPKTFGTGKSTVKQIEALKAKEAGPNYSQNELDLLENLAKRRDELDQRERDLDIKSKVLDATQKRIDDKIAEMKTLEVQLSKVVAQYNDKQNAQIASLVKIYEGMKPIQAAAIFNELDMPILLEVIDKMSERKVSPVLALMDPKKARDVTQELAAMRKANPAPGKPGAAPAAAPTK